MLILHAADIHLDSPMVGLDAYEGCPRDALRGATRRALENLVRTALDERAALLLVSGDLYDGDWKDHQTGLYFASQMRRLAEGGVRVVLLRGNHDAASEITKRVHLPPNVRELSVDAPETIVFEDLGVAVHGRGFPERDVREDYARTYPAPRGGLFNIGMLHTALHGRPGHELYAPTTLNVLVDRGYDYWALGHVHETEIVHTAPHVVFPGNLQGRHVRETGPKGAFALTVEDGRLLHARHRTFDHVRYADCVLEAQPDDGWDDVLDRVRDTLVGPIARAEGRLLAARLRVMGGPRCHRKILRERDAFVAEVRSVASEVGQDRVWLGDVRVETREPFDLDALTKANDPLSHLLRAVTEARSDPAALAELGATLADLANKLPKGLRDDPEFAFLDDPAALAPILDDVRELLFARLIPPPEEP